MKEFREKFKIESLEIKQVGSWIISLRPKQVTLGSMILSLDRKCPHFSELTAEEGEELSEAFKMLEDLLRSTFSPDKINYLALMMLDEQVHFHVIPRYKEQIVYNNEVYDDAEWPKPPNVLSAIKMSDNVLAELCAKFRKINKS